MTLVNSADKDSIWFSGRSGSCKLNHSQMVTKLSPTAIAGTCNR